MSLAIISHPECLLHEMGEGHPEQAERIKVIAELCQQEEFKKVIKTYEAPLATSEQLARAHDPKYIQELFSRSPNEGLIYLDPDTAMNPFTLQAAMRAAGAVVQAVDLVLSGEVERVFCNVRPPGHHAERTRAMGFCFFNNVAVGVAHALAQHKLERIAIIDFDVHHGNGTEDIFKTDERVLLCSSFQHPFYPFSGAETISNHILNISLPEGTEGGEWRERIEDSWLQELKNFKPQLLFFSAGFDGYVGDDLANFCLEEGDYAWVTEQVLQITAESAKGRAISVLEGGYDLEGLSLCVAAHLRALL
jgi:acetoin utilization deacetylase AcuC-like enzyme